MARLEIEDKLEIMNMVSEIAAGAAQNPNLGPMVQVQTELVEELYRTMVALIEEGDEEEEGEDADDD